MDNTITMTDMDALREARVALLLYAEEWQVAQSRSHCFARAHLAEGNVDEATYWQDHHSYAGGRARAALDARNAIMQML